MLPTEFVHLMAPPKEPDELEVKEHDWKVTFESSI